MEIKKKNSKKTGRPSKGGNKLTIPINLKLTAKDFNSVKEKAGKLGISPTQYAREIVLKGSIKSRFSLEQLDLMRKLSGMANNLNQIAKHTNKYGLTNTGMDIIMIAEQIKKLFHDR